MFKTQDQFTNSFFGSYAYDPIINRDQDHILVKMDKFIDWSFVENEVADCYSTKGQKAIHPVKMFKLLIIQTANYEIVFFHIYPCCHLRSFAGHLSRFTRISTQINADNLHFVIHRFKIFLIYQTETQ